MASARLVAGVAAVALLGIGAGIARPARPEEPTPVGRWITVDDRTGKPSSVVEIREVDGKLEGRVASLVVAPGEDPDPKCTKCDGELKGKPITGMVILRDLVPDGGGRRWSGGRILDPDEGSTYRCRLEVVDGGAKLEVRGYVGISLLGRTQTWIRARGAP